METRAMQECLEAVWLNTSEVYAREARKISFGRKVSFHGWPHVNFVAKNAHKFALELRADPVIAEIAGLVHDVNYLVNARSDAQDGADLRQKILSECGMESQTISVIEKVVVSAQTSARGRNISREAMALSDADTLFKALPITPVILSPLYMKETRRSLRELAEKIASEQIPLREDEIYFYSDSAKKKYENWGDANLRLWSLILESLDDPWIVELVTQMEEYTKIPAEPVEEKRGMRAALGRVRNGLRT
jgi:uncharacterized protein